MHRLLRRSNGGYSLCEPNWLHPALEVRATAKPKLGGMFKNGTLGPPVHTGGLFLGSGPGLSPLYPNLSHLNQLVHRTVRKAGVYFPA